jgi:hypothetical protein
MTSEVVLCEGCHTSYEFYVEEDDHEFEGEADSGEEKKVPWIEYCPKCKPDALKWPKGVPWEYTNKLRNDMSFKKRKPADPIEARVELLKPREGSPAPVIDDILYQAAKKIRSLVTTPSSLVDVGRVIASVDALRHAQSILHDAVMLPSIQFDE